MRCARRWRLRGATQPCTAGTRCASAAKKLFAKEAGVEAGAVDLKLTAGSVVISATIYFASQAAADEKGSALATGILKDAASLETALITQFQSDGVSTTNLKIEALTPPAVAGGGISTGAIVGIIIGGVAVVAGIVVGVVCYLKKKKKKKTRRRLRPRRQYKLAQADDIAR